MTDPSNEFLVETNGVAEFFVIPIAMIACSVVIRCVIVGLLFGTTESRVVLSGKLAVTIASEQYPKDSTTSHDPWLGSQAFIASMIFPTIMSGVYEATSSKALGG